MGKREEVLANYHLKGFLLKQAGDTLFSEGKLDGVLNGLAGETHEDGSVYIFQIKRGKETVVRPWMQYKEGKVEELEGGSFSVTYVVPEGRSRGLFVSKRNRVLVPLKC